MKETGIFLRATNFLFFFVTESCRLVSSSLSKINRVLMETGNETDRFHPKFGNIWSSTERYSSEYGDGKCDKIFVTISSEEYLQSMASFSHSSVVKPLTFTDKLYGQCYVIGWRTLNI